MAKSDLYFGFFNLNNALSDKDEALASLSRKDFRSSELDKDEMRVVNELIETVLSEIGNEDNLAEWISSYVEGLESRDSSRLDNLHTDLKSFSRPVSEMLRQLINSGVEVLEEHSGMNTHMRESSGGKPEVTYFTKNSKEGSVGRFSRVP